MLCYASLSVTSAISEIQIWQVGIRENRLRCASSQTISKTNSDYDSIKSLRVLTDTEPLTKLESDVSNDEVSMMVDGGRGSDPTILRRYALLGGKKKFI